MRKINGSALMYGAEDIKTTHAFLPRLIRIIFYRNSITNNDWIDRYFRNFSSIYKNKTINRHRTDRITLDNKKSLTFNMMSHVLTAMGYDIECISIRLKDKTTGEIRTYSTDDTVDLIEAELEKEKSTGIQSLT